MTMTATYDRNESNGSASLIRSGFATVFTNLVAARERQMQHRVDSVLENLDRETLKAHGFKGRARP